MKAKLAVVVLLVAVIAVVAALYFGPGRPTPPAPSRPSTPSRPAATAQTPAPTEVVTSYINALTGKKYETAYQLLSKESRQKHPYDQFVDQVEKTGVTEYDLTTAKVRDGETGSKEVTVDLQLKEDPAVAGFRLTKESEAWHIVYNEGIPSFPYP